MKMLVEMQAEMDGAERRKPRKKLARRKQKRGSSLPRRAPSWNAFSGEDFGSVSTLVSDWNRGGDGGGGGGGFGVAGCGGGDAKASASDEFMEVWNRGEQKMAEKRRKALAAKRRKATNQRLSQGGASAALVAAAAARRKKKNGVASGTEPVCMYISVHVLPPLHTKYACPHKI